MTATADAIRKELSEIADAKEKLEARRRVIYERLTRIEERYVEGILSIEDLAEKLERVKPETLFTAPGGAPVTLAYLHAYRMSWGVATLGVDMHMHVDAPLLTVGALAEALRSAVGVTFEHRKGAEYEMTAASKVRLCELHEPGDGVFGIRRVEGHVELVTRPEP